MTYVPIGPKFLSDVMINVVVRRGSHGKAICIDHVNSQVDLTRESVKTAPVVLVRAETAPYFVAQGGTVIIGCPIGKYLSRQSAIGEDSITRLPTDTKDGLIDPVIRTNELALIWVTEDGLESVVVGITDGKDLWRTIDKIKSSHLTGTNRVASFSVAASIFLVVGESILVAITRTTIDGKRANEGNELFPGKNVSATGCSVFAADNR